MLKKLFLAVAILTAPSVVQANPMWATSGGQHQLGQIQAFKAHLAELQKRGVLHSEPLQVADAKTDEFCMYAGVLYTKGAILPIEGQSPLICQQNIHSTGGMNDPLVWVKLDDWNRAINGDSPK